MISNRNCQFFLLAGSVLALQACEEKPACPQFSISAMPQPGEVGKVLFVLKMPAQLAQISGPFDYAWTVSAGEIVAGQFTPSILVAAPSGVVTASLEIRGIPESCQAFGSSTFGVP